MAKKRQSGDRMPSQVGPIAFEYTPEVFDKIRELANDGLTEGQIAIKIGRHPTTFSRDKDNYPLIDQCLKEGEADLVQLACRELKNKIKEGDTTAMIFTLKAKGRWSDRQMELEANNALVESIATKVLTGPELILAIKHAKTQTDENK